MKQNVNLKFRELDYQRWYGETDFAKNLTTGLILGLVFYFFVVFFGFRMYSVVSFGVSFYDPSSAFAEHLIHLYNIVWIILIFVVFFILVLLVRIIYLFNWNFFYFSSDIYNILVKNVLEYYLALNFMYESNDEDIIEILKRINLVEAGNAGSAHVGLNLWYNKDSGAFLSISDISEYRALEFIWCLLPIGSLLAISTPTFSLIFSLDACVDPAYTIKIIGRQWYWTYAVNGFVDNFTEGDNEALLAQYDEKNVRFLPIQEYNNNNLRMNGLALPVNFEFDSSLVSDEDLAFGAHRILEVDNRLLLPVGVPIRLLITSSDVLHSWAVPSLGIKVDAVPGRLNQFIVEIKRPGVFYGQCSELCGPFHGFMPIVIQATTMDNFENWMMKKTTDGF